MNIHSYVMSENIDKVSDKRHTILQATLGLITEHGFHGTPMSKIAEAAEVGAGTIYRYFANKEDLINELYKEIKARMIQAMLQDFSEELPLRENFVRIYRNTVNFYKNHPQEMTFGEQYTNSPFIYSSTREENSKRFQPFIQLLEDGRKQQIIKDLPTPMLVGIVFGILKSHVRLHLDQQVDLNEALTESSIATCWDAIRL